MAKDHELSGLIKWSRREEWADLFEEVLGEHFGTALDDYGIDFERLEELIGEQNMTNLWGCAFEDFLTQPHSPDNPQTIVDDYLKRRGWKESPSTRRYMEALRDSVFSLYEVGEVVPGQSMVLRDLLRESHPATVAEHLASRTIRPGDRLGCRVVEVAGRYRMAGGFALFDAPQAAAVTEQIGSGVAAMQAAIDEDRAGNAAPDGQNVDQFVDRDFLLSGWAPEFTAIWLDSHLEGRLPKVPPPSCNSDGDDLQFHTVSYDLTAGASPDTVARLLDTVPDLRFEDDGLWNWVEAKEGAFAAAIGQEEADANLVRSEVRDGRLHVELEDGTPVLASIELFEDGLVLFANSKTRADRAKVMLKSVLKGLVGQPQTRVANPRGVEEPS